MKTQLEKVKEFNKVFGLLINDKPAFITNNDFRLKYRLMYEELGEYFNACLNRDLVELLDAIVDMQYILDGIKIAHGISQELFDKAFDEVHRSNMSKLEDGKPIYREDGKVMKGKDYFKPNLKQFLST